jgi:hypothetical protein
MADILLFFVIILSMGVPVIVVLEHDRVGGNGDGEDDGGDGYGDSDGHGDE